MMKQATTAVSNAAAKTKELGAQVAAAAVALMPSGAQRSIDKSAITEHGDAINHGGEGLPIHLKEASSGPGMMKQTKTTVSNAAAKTKELGAQVAAAAASLMPSGVQSSIDQSAITEHGDAINHGGEDLPIHLKERLAASSGPGMMAQAKAAVSGAVSDAADKAKDLSDQLAAKLSFGGVDQPVVTQHVSECPFGGVDQPVATPMQQRMGAAAAWVEPFASPLAVSPASSSSSSSSMMEQAKASLNSAAAKLTPSNIDKSAITRHGDAINHGGDRKIPMDQVPVGPSHQQQWQHQAQPLQQPAQQHFSRVREKCACGGVILTDASGVRYCPFCHQTGQNASARL